MHTSSSATTDWEWSSQSPSLFLQIKMSFSICMCHLTLSLLPRVLVQANLGWQRSNETNFPSPPSARGDVRMYVLTETVWCFCRFRAAYFRWSNLKSITTRSANKLASITSGTLRKNVSVVQKSRRTSIERSFFAECPWKRTFLVTTRKDNSRIV
jgi:hypothetical protein